ncbi:MAG TPA: hypothetical protein VFT15_18325 [Chitinophagaceae bacterium]|nr:hypothetical protein [Chitinophagaceae bacterium]
MVNVSDDFRQFLNGRPNEYFDREKYRYIESPFILMRITIHKI